VNLIIDIGNTCIKLVAFDGGKVVDERRSDKNDVASLKDFCNRYPFADGIFSAVSDISDEYRTALQSLPFRMLELRSGVTRVPIKNMYATPETLGTDRLAAVVGANMLQPGHDLLIIDIGTCVTFDFVNSKGEYLGGNISPGPSMRLRALNDYTARLPLVSRKGDTPDVGNDTETAIRSGVINGVKYEIEGYIRFFLAKYPQLFVYLTGGVHLNLEFSKNLPIFADDFIVPKGLNRILEYNNEHK